MKILLHANADLKLRTTRHGEGYDPENPDADNHQNRKKDYAQHISTHGETQEPKKVSISRGTLPTVDKADRESCACHPYQISS